MLNSKIFCIHHLFNVGKLAPAPQKRTRFDLYKNVDADYYGYRDEEDGTLLEYEREIENGGTKIYHSNESFYDFLRL